MESAGTFNCQRFDCPRDPGDCSRCDRPSLTKDVAAILTIYRRCRQWKLLPNSGGLFDQNERLMALLDFVDGEVERCNSKKIDDERNDAMKKNMISQMGGQRG